MYRSLGQTSLMEARPRYAALGPYEVALGPWRKLLPGPYDGAASNCAQPGQASPLYPLCGRPFLYWGHRTCSGDV